MIKYFAKYKFIFYLCNFILIVLYLFPGSLIGWFVYKDLNLQPQITTNFIVSTNHVYAFMALSILGYISYKNQKLNFLFIYLLLISVFLEILHIIIPNRGFEFTDLFGNILGVLIVYFFHHTYNYFYNSKNDKKKF